MKFKITLRKVNIKDETKDKMYKKLTKLDKFFK